MLVGTGPPKLYKYNNFEWIIMQKVKILPCDMSKASQTICKLEREKIIFLIQRSGAYTSSSGLKRITDRAPAVVDVVELTLLSSLATLYLSDMF